MIAPGIPGGLWWPMANLYNQAKSSKQVLNLIVACQIKDICTENIVTTHNLSYTLFLVLVTMTMTAVIVIVTSYFKF